MPAPWLLALGLVLALLVLLPASRLQLAGLSPRVIGLYALCLWLLAMLVAIRPVAARFLDPDPDPRVPRAVRGRAGARRPDAGPRPRRPRSDGPGADGPGADGRPVKDVTPPDQHDPS